MNFSFNFSVTTCQLYSNTFLHVFTVFLPVLAMYVYFLATAVHFVSQWKCQGVGNGSAQYYWSVADEPKEQNSHSTFQTSFIQCFSALCRKCGVSDTLGMIFLFLSLLEVTKVLFPTVVLVNHNLCFPDLHYMDGSLVLVSIVCGDLLSKPSFCGVFENKSKRILLSAFLFSFFSP